MPLLRKEPEVFPEELFSLPTRSAPWLIAHVRSRQEKLLARHLKRTEVPFYLPQIEKTTRRSGRTLKSYVPLFPGYVFLRDGNGVRDAAWKSNVVARILDVDDQALLDGELCQLRKLQEAGASLTPHLAVVAGTAVTITDGVFTGYTGVVMREKDHARLIITVSHLHRAVAVELSRDAVARSNS